MRLTGAVIADDEKPFGVGRLRELKLGKDQVAE